MASPNPPYLASKAARKIIEAGYLSSFEYFGSAFFLVKNLLTSFFSRLIECRNYIS